MGVQNAASTAGWRFEVNAVKYEIRQAGAKVADCVTTADRDGVPYLYDTDVEPRLPDGEYELWLNGAPFRGATRKDGQWTSRELN